MYFQVTRGGYSAGNEDVIGQAIRQQTIPAMKQQPGFRGYTAGVDRTTGRFVGVSIWRTNVQATESNTKRTQLDSLVQLQAPELYLVAVLSPIAPRLLTSAGAPGAVFRVSRGSYDITKQDQLKQVVMNHILPATRTSPGVLGFMGGAQQSEGKLLLMTLWDTIDHAKAIEQQRATYGALVQLEPAELYELSVQA